MANPISNSAQKHFITSAKAREMKGKFKGMKDKILRQEFLGKNMLPISETFDKAAIQALLDQPRCVKFRSYFGMNDNMEVSVVLVGVDENDQDLLAQTAAEGDDDFVIIEEGMRCPPDCPPPPPPPPPIG
jgi:hypothetical protein